uniref:Uncharacterized protein n=1 Tax=Candidatus Kentrum sp. TC TaxID=2126339 RepID=A0A450YHT1_9GAMM|nr:MAG: hypothetical protein BECKTC1821E_GA0114239_100947 [Candidatus Kentron sp. TC]VFK55561.1 MAG: hypothetical protein BECKTC1821F_GA0114240_100727 [Candidatus Kentron sp. TC]
MNGTLGKTLLESILGELSIVFLEKNDIGKFAPYPNRIPNSPQFSVALVRDTGKVYFRLIEKLVRYHQFVANRKHHARRK